MFNRNLWGVSKLFQDFDTALNKKDYDTIAEIWSNHSVQLSEHISLLERRQGILNKIIKLAKNCADKFIKDYIESVNDIVLLEVANSHYPRVEVKTWLQDRIKFLKDKLVLPMKNNICSQNFSETKKQAATESPLLKKFMKVLYEELEPTMETWYQNPVILSYDISLLEEEDKLKIFRKIIQYNEYSKKGSQRKDAFAFLNDYIERVEDIAILKKTHAYFFTGGARTRREITDVLYKRIVVLQLALEAEERAKAPQQKEPVHLSSHSSAPSSPQNCDDVAVPNLFGSPKDDDITKQRMFNRETEGSAANVKKFFPDFDTALNTKNYDAIKKIWLDHSVQLSKEISLLKGKKPQGVLNKILKLDKYHASEFIHDYIESVNDITLLEVANENYATLEVKIWLRDRIRFLKSQQTVQPVNNKKQAFEESPLLQTFRTDVLYQGLDPAQEMWFQHHEGLSLEIPQLKEGDQLKILRKIIQYGQKELEKAMPFLNHYVIRVNNITILSETYQYARNDIKAQREIRDVLKNRIADLIIKSQSKERAKAPQQKTSIALSSHSPAPSSQSRDNLVVPFDLAEDDFELPFTLSDLPAPSSSQNCDDVAVPNLFGLPEDDDGALPVHLYGEKSMPEFPFKTSEEWDDPFTSNTKKRRATEEADSYGISKRNIFTPIPPLPCAEESVDPDFYKRFLA